MSWARRILFPEHQLPSTCEREIGTPGCPNFHEQLRASRDTGSRMKLDEERHVKRVLPRVTVRLRELWPCRPTTRNGEQP